MIAPPKKESSAIGQVAWRAQSSSNVVSLRGDCGGGGRMGLDGTWMGLDGARSDGT